MKKSLLILGIIISSVLSNPYAVQVPVFRAGSESVALGETGVGFSSSLESHFYNPANSALFGAERKVKAALSGGIERVMPNHYEKCYYSNGTAAFFTPIADSLFNMAALFSATFLSHEIDVIDYVFDEELLKFSDAITVEKDMFHSSFRWGVSLAWKTYLSLGVDCKYYKGSLTQDADDKTFVTEMINSDYDTDFLSWNVGVRGQYQFDLQEKFFIKPSLGFSMLGLSKDSVTIESSVKENYNYPVYSSLLFGGAVTLGNEDVIWGSLIYDNSRDLDDYDWFTNSLGLRVNVTPALSLNTGLLLDNDNGGDRREFHWGATLGYRSLQMNRFYRKTKKSRYVDTELKNVELLYSFSVITPLNDNVSRQGQHSHQVTILFDFGKSRGTGEVKLSDTEVELGISE